MPDDRHVYAESIEILSACSELLREDEVREVQWFADAGECGVAIETLCAFLQERNVAVAMRIYLRIKSLGQLLKIDARYYEGLDRE